MQTRFIIIILLILTSCTPRLIAQPDPTQIPLTSSPAEQIRPTFTPAQGNIPNMTPILQNLIENAKEDLAQRLSISTTQIFVVEAKDVTWSNSSLGCPQLGMAYADVLTPGYLIILTANGVVYEYHAGKSSKAFYCENPLPPVEGVPDNT